MDVVRRVKVGSRKSQLALVQTNCVVDALKSIRKNVTFEIVTMMTTGDHILDKPLSKIGEKSLFTKELEAALMDGLVDLVVHSLKDLPTALPSGVAIGAICHREDPSDAVVLRKDISHLALESLPEGSVVGTSSLRRIAQLRRVYPNLVFKTARGNLNTRLRKLDESGEYSALILATAGIVRMGWKDRISQRLPLDVCMYAVGQGALAVEVRADDQNMLDLISQLNHGPTILRCIAERAFLKTLEGGCSVPVAVHSEVVDDKVVLVGGVFSLDGSQRAVATHRNDASSNDEKLNGDGGVCGQLPIICGVQNSTLSTNALKLAEATGVQLAEILLTQGAKVILAEARREHESSS